MEPVLEHTASFIANKSKFIKAGIIKPDPVIVKDQNYFRDKSWNSPYMASSRMHNFYHKKNSENNKLIAERENRIKEDSRIQKEQLTKFLIDKTKVETRKSMNRATEHRVQLQLDSGQKVLDRSAHEERPRVELPLISSQPLESKAITDKRKPSLKFSTNHLRFDKVNNQADKTTKKLKLVDGRPDNVWNQYSTMSKKHLSNSITCKIVEMDHQGFSNIQEKENEEKIRDRILDDRKKLIKKLIDKRRSSNITCTVNQPLHVIRKSATTGPIEFEDASRMILVNNQGQESDESTLLPMLGFASKINSLTCEVQNPGVSVLRRKLSLVGYASSTKNDIAPKMCPIPEEELEAKQQDIPDEDSATFYDKHIRKFDKHLKARKSLTMSEKYPGINLGNLAKF
jgi:hypothetical protein